MPGGFSLAIAEHAGKAGLFTTGPVPGAKAQIRLSEGDFCVVVSDKSGLAAQMWASERARFIEWIGCKIVPEDQHVHLFNAWVRPDVRGRGLQWILASEACRNVIRNGRTKVFAGVERVEYAPFARKYAAMGLGLLIPIRSVWAGRLFGVTIAINTRPPKALHAAMLGAKSILSRRRG